MEHKHWLDYQMEDVPYEDWDVLAQSDYQEYMELRREERYDREHLYDDIFGEEVKEEREDD